MIAAIYARKSTEQNGVGDEDKSVTRQIEHAKAYAAKKGWRVDQGHIFQKLIGGEAFQNTPDYGGPNGIRWERGRPPRGPHGSGLP
jgi:DNA invertase Pin-like site-specific DNA recombinase